ncbi:MAG: cell division ATP-binding protein FtsE [Deltaproteobacteria bacterium]|nr:cell division ATP-binding protein FtsE [Deltaproteobacteria bacterium]MBW2305592.1 cell division ATP-binding protein FtsE [Deltaproteobacteria bacterium]
MIQIYRVCKTYQGDICALTNINLHIQRGGFIFLTGPSGAGKTTLLKLLLCAERPTSGHIIIDGRNIDRIKPWQIPLLRRRIGVVFQDFKLLYNRTVFENVAFALEVIGASREEIRKRVLYTLKMVRLQQKAGVMPHRLSGGEQQRVAIARSIVHEPIILLADEPTGNLDPDLTLEIIADFETINARGTTIIVATHDYTLVNRFRRRVVELRGGHIVSDVPAPEEKQFEAPLHGF